MPSLGPWRSTRIAAWLLLAVGCHHGLGSDYDGGPIDERSRAGDTDGDGLCDVTEHDSTGTDPLVADSDGDGIPDGYEYEIGTDPTRPTSPDPLRIVVLSEAAAASTQVTIVRQVYGVGESFVAGVQAEPVIDPANLMASAFLTAIIAEGAAPRTNVAQIDRTGARFLAVQGETQLGWEVGFAFGVQTVRGCARLYPWRFDVKTGDGDYVYASQYLLEIVPPGQTAATASWCPIVPCL